MFIRTELDQEKFYWQLKIKKKELNNDVENYKLTKDKKVLVNFNLTNAINTVVMFISIHIGIKYLRSLQL